MMIWQKLGQIFIANNHFDWMQTHAALPIPINVEAGIFRIYFSTRDKNNRSHGAFLDINIKNPQRLLDISSKPVLSPGDRGLFDDSGVSLSSYCSDTKLFYYLGWNLMITVPFSNKIGAAQLTNNELQKVGRVPLLQICNKEPYSFGYPFVMKIGRHYKMWYEVLWYDTNMIWNSNSTSDYYFMLRSATSSDGKIWEKDYFDCLPMKEGERGISRPCVLIDNSLFRMWYSINSNGKYRIGYAESPDGMNWIRKDDEVGITASESGWDSEEIEYPYVFDHDSERYMLYNGNGYGKTGFGLARLIKD